MDRGAVLVTGGARRIGRAISLRLAAEGYSVAVHYRSSEDDAAEVVGQIHSGGGSAVAVQADLSDAEAAASLVSRASSLGPLCGLVNNASLFAHDDIDSIDSESWDAHMDVNAKSPMLLIRSLNQHIDDNGRACVVNVLDQKIAEPNPDHLSYTSLCPAWAHRRTRQRARPPHQGQCRGTRSHPAERRTDRDRILSRPVRVPSRIRSFSRRCRQGRILLIGRQGSYRPGAVRGLRREVPLPCKGCPVRDGVRSWTATAKLS